MESGDSDIDGVPLDESRVGADLIGALDEARTAVVVLGLDATVRAANRAALELIGGLAVDDARPGGRTAEHDAAGQPGALRALLDHAPRHLATGTSPGTWHGDIDVTGRGGERLVFRATVVVHHVIGDGGSVVDGSISLVAHDVTNARDEAARLRHRASHDPLTGLANRRQVVATLARAVSRQRERPGHVAAVFVDLDHLKFVNDALGHHVGDRLLVATAQRLADSVRPQDHVARIGGDEFLVVCTDVADGDAAMEIAERVRRALTGRLRLRELDLHFSVSIGVALTTAGATASDAAQASELIGNADTAMYEAKGSGRGRCVLFTPEMRTATRERTALGAELARAIADRRLTLDYQPVFSAVTRDAVGAEALVRWHHATRGPIPPVEFIAIAEQSGTIGRLGQLVLEQSLLQLRLWIDQGVVAPDFALHVNVSKLQLASASFVNLVSAILRQHGLRPHQLVVEAREAALLGRNDDVDRTVRALRRIGVRIAIDNFGTGASALSLLTEVGADILKLDATHGLAAGSTGDTRLVRALVLLAHALDMRVVAERVSGPEQLARLRAAGCDLLQGNLLAPPAGPDWLVTAAPY